jgi:predicted transposase YdaD
MSEALEQTWEQWVAEREQRAEARGEARGTAEGRLQARREDLRDLLQERFGALPDEVSQRIDACNDLDRLKAAIRGVLAMKSLEELTL